MPRSPFTERKKQELQKIIGRFGSTMNNHQLAFLLKVTEKQLGTFLKTKDGKDCQVRGMTLFRASLVEKSWKALETDGKGSAGALKMLLNLVEEDKGSRLDEMELSRSDLLDIMDRSSSAIAKRMAQGQMIRTNAKKQYRVLSLLKLIPTLWDIISDERTQRAKFERRLSGYSDFDEAKRQKLIEEVKEKSRRNNIAEGKLVDKEAARELFSMFSNELRLQSRRTFSEVALKLHLSATQQEELEVARRLFLSTVGRRVDEYAKKMDEEMEHVG